VTRGADWLDLNTFPPAEYTLPRTRRLFNTSKTRFGITTSQCAATTLTCHNGKTCFPGVEEPSGPWYNIFRRLKGIQIESVTTECHSSRIRMSVFVVWFSRNGQNIWLSIPEKPDFQVLRSLVVLGRAYSAGGKVFRSSQSASRVTAVGSESLYSWFDSA